MKFVKILLFIVSFFSVSYIANATNESLDQRKNHTEVKLNKALVKIRLNSHAHYQKKLHHILSKALAIDPNAKFLVKVIIQKDQNQFVNSELRKLAIIMNSVGISNSHISQEMAPNHTSQDSEIHIFVYNI